MPVSCTRLLMLVLAIPAPRRAEPFSPPVEPPPPVAAPVARGVLPTVDTAGSVNAGILAMFDAQCNAGDAQSCIAIGSLYEHGQMGAPSDRARAKEYYARGCALGNASACSLRDTISGPKR